MKAGPFKVDGDHESIIRTAADAQKVGLFEQVIRAITSN